MLERTRTSYTHTHVSLENCVKLSLLTESPTFVNVRPTSILHDMGRLSGEDALISLKAAQQERLYFMLCKMTATQQFKSVTKYSP